jgi:hypothetical protein
MSLLIYSGLLYLFGISLILYFKPELMFSKDGNWKEFGLGRNKLKYTWMPFWLFTILWAILSYLITLMIASITRLSGVSNNTDVVVSNDMLAPQNVSTKAMSPVLSKKRPSSVDEMKRGYYILDASETMKKGVPKYIYLGPEAPNLVYHNMTSNGEMHNALQGEQIESSDQE